MTDTQSPIESLFDRAEDYGKSTIELFKLNAIDKTADVVSSLVSRLVVFIAIAFSLLILSIGASFWIGEQMEKSYYGFLVVGGFYAFIALLFAIFRHQFIKNSVSDTMISKMMKQKTI